MFTKRTVSFKQYCTQCVQYEHHSPLGARLLGLDGVLGVGAAGHCFAATRECAELVVLN